MVATVRTSVLEIAEAFLRPASYTVDIDRLLLGREAAFRTHTVGVLHLIIHRAEDLPKTDAVGE
jgi:Ca2+-dependent lipid-binding protein